MFVNFGTNHGLRTHEGKIPNSLRPKFKSQSQIDIWELLKGLVFCRNNGWIMENMDKELRIPKWVLIVWPKISRLPQKISAQNVCLSPKVRDFWKKNSLWVPVVRGWYISFLRWIHGIILKPSETVNGLVFMSSKKKLFQDYMHIASYILQGQFYEQLLLHLEHCVTQLLAGGICCTCSFLS